MEPVVDATLAALAELPDAVREGAHLVFVTHSIPTAMDDEQRPRGRAPTSRSTAAWPRRSSSRVRQETGRRHPHELVYCSRSGSPHMPWLEPDVNDHLRGAAPARASRRW